jgi:4-amino-4-deoxy-L-arabinose transferase-like glycosyltransferase
MILKRSTVAFWLLILLLMFWGLGDTPLTDVDEGAFAEASREMLYRGDWISPWLLDSPRFDKPVLIHWLQMLTFQFFGVSSFSARLPSAISGLFWIGITATWARLISLRYLRDLNPETVYLSALAISGASVGIIGISRASTADALLNALMAATCYALWRFFDDPENAPRCTHGWARWAAVFTALGILTKGPIAVLVALVASFFGAWGASSNGWTRLRTLFTSPSCWLILFSLSLPWYYLQFRAQGDAFITGFFGVHNIGRYTTTMHGFSSGILYYPFWTMVALLPWTTVLLRTPFEMWSKGVYRLNQVRMCWGIFAFVLVFFTLSATKLPHYGFYGLTGLIIVMSIVLGYIAQRHSAWRGLLTERIIISINLFLLALTPWWWPHLIPLVHDTYYAAVLADASVYFDDRNVLWLSAAGIGFFVVILGHRFIVLVLGALTCTATLYFGIVAPLIMAFRQPVLEAAEIIRLSTNPVITWRLTAPSLSFAAQRVIKSVEPTRGTTIVMHSKDSNALNEVLLKKYQFSPLVNLLWEKGGISIVHIH